jgi:hypothetical protein
LLGIAKKLEQVCNRSLGRLLNGEDERQSQPIRTAQYVTQRYDGGIVSAIN